MKWLLVACAVAWATAAPLAGQDLSVLPVSDLQFGDLLPGMSESVAPGDVLRRAEVHVLGRGRVTIVVTLPTQLASLQGHTLPLVFSATDGRYQNGSDPAAVFDPRSPITLNLRGSNPMARIWFGGTAQPSQPQAPGQYAAVLSVQVFPGGV